MPDHQHSREARKNELRLFVSSTFRDLQPEREQLVKKVFPRIRKECRQRGVEFTEIDLRWGITEDESRTGKTIRICLEEIDRCRPYFIGIIGSRYGWVPGITEIEKDREMLKEFPWLRDFAAKEKSIIEMEFAHGALLEKNDSSFFYEQVLSGSVDGMDAMDNLDTTLSNKSIASTGLSTLKETLQSTGVPYRRFNDPEELGELVFQDIISILDRDFPAKRDLTPLERERIEHEAFSINRRRAYVANPAYYDAFVKHVESDGPPLVIWGRSGLGKSALMAHLAHEYQTQNPNAFVVQHFIGAAEGSDPEDVIRQVMMEIKERYALSETVPTDDTTLREEFPVWLAKVGSNPLLKKEGAGGGLFDAQEPPPNPLLLKEGETDKLVVFIDALNQLTGVATEMHWLPEFIPDNVRLVLSTTADSVPLEQLRKRNWNEVELQPLTEHQREAIASNFLKRYRKSLPQKDLHRLSSDPKSSSPLFLRTVLEELRIFGHHQSLHEHLADYLGSTDERELFQKVLARLERDHGEESVRSVMTAIWASRHGLSEAELMEITGKPRMALSELMIAMEYHLMVREGFHTFFHNFLREAIEQRYVPEEAVRKAAHAALGEYFATREFGHRRMNEEPWQWQAAQDNDRLKQSLLAPEMLALLETQHEQYEAFGYWRGFDRIELDAGYIPRLMDPTLESETVVEAFTNAVDLIVLSSAYAQADEFFVAGYPVVEKIEMDAEHRLTLREKRILILNHLGKYKEAAELAQAMLNESEMAKHPKIRVGLLDQFSYALHYLGRYEEAEKIITASIEYCMELYGPRSREIISRYNNLAAVLLFQSRFQEAEDYLQKVIAIVQELFGTNHTEMAYALMQLGSYFNKVGCFKDAKVEFEKAEAIYLRTTGPEHFQTCICRQQLAGAEIGLNDIQAARALYQSVVSIMIKKFGMDHPQTMSSGIGVGFTYYLEGNYESAIPYYERFLPYYEETYGAENPETIKRRNRLEEMREKVRSKR
jgi:nephrocystin-3